jgi:VWFA-related protein
MMGARFVVTAAVVATAASIGPPAGRTARQQPDSGQVFRASVESVLVSVSVKQGNVPVAGLTAADFRVSDNGVEQQVEVASVEALPVDVTVFHDTSPSQAGRLDALKQDVRRIAAMLRRGERFRLLALGTNYQVVDAFGWVPAGTPLDLDRVTISPITSVNDGVLAALVHRPSPGRRHLVVTMTDAADIGSAVTSVQVLEVARRSNSVLHLVTLSGSGQPIAQDSWKPTPWDRGSQANLARAAELTGGEAHRRFLGIGSPDPVAAFGRILDDFRSSYVLRYTAAGIDRSGWHDIQVEVPDLPSATIRARRGYWGG